MPAWVTPPVFSYGYPASVDDLNVVRNDLLYLFGEIFTTSSATIESLVKVNSPYDCQDGGVDDGTGIAAVQWIEHKTDNLQYRIRIKSEATTHTVRLHIRYYEAPYVRLPTEPNDEMGMHQEIQELIDADTFYLFTNSDVAVDISGWGLTVGDMYSVVVSLDATTDDNQDCWVEVSILQEVP